MADQTNTILKKLQAHQKRITDVVTELATLLPQDADDDITKRNRQAQALQVKASQIKCHLPLFDKLIDELREAAQREADPGLETQSDTLYDLYLEALDTMTRAESTAQNFISRPINTVSSAQPPPIVVPTVAKLPKQELPTFSGDVMQFRTFIQQFEASVHNHPSLAPVQKFNYLLSLLKGEARKSLEGFDVEDGSYATALQILKDRYGDTLIIIRSLHRRFDELPSCSNCYSDLSQFVDELEAVFRTLKSLGEAPSSQQLAAKMFAKLPEEACMAIQQSAKGPAPNAESLLDHLKTYVKRKRVSTEGQALNEAESGSFNTAEALVVRGRPGYQNPSRQGSNTNYSTSRQGQIPSWDRWIMKCSFCQAIGNHYTTGCRGYSVLQDRLDRARQLMLCFNCLSPGHSAYDCRSRGFCRTCQQPGHHTPLCRTSQPHDDQNWRSSNRQDNSRTTPIAKSNARAYAAGTFRPDDEAERTDVNYAALSSRTREEECVTLLQSAQAVAVNGAKYEKVRVLLDSCSNRTFITAKLANDLNLKQESGRPLEINVFGSAQAKRIPTNTAKIALRMRDGGIIEMECTVLPLITGKYKRSAIRSEALVVASRKFDLADYLPDKPDEMEVDVLIGNDYYADVVLGNRQKIEENLYIIESRLGWVLSGRAYARAQPASAQEHAMTGITLKCAVVTDQPQANFAVNAYPYLPKPPCLSDLWSLDTLGIKDQTSNKEDEDAEAFAQFKQSIRMENGRYVARFPWIEEKLDSLSDHYEVSLRRFQILVKRLQARPDLLKKYDDIIREQLRTNITEEVDPLQPCGRVINYLPHREIEKPEKETTKIRIVYDASAKQGANNISLNDCMRRRPVLLENLSGILMRFRLSQVAVVADIEKAFHQVVLDSRDRDATRFLWLRDVNGPAIPGNVVTLRFQRVLFGAKASPMLLEGTLDHHLTTKQSPVCELINGNTYMDNLITGVHSESEALAFYHETKSVFYEIGMNMREWASNCEAFLSSIPDQDRCKPEVLKILGVTWDTKSDQFRFDVPKKSLIDVKTKRDLVSAVASVFDPNGLILPLTLKGKLLLQKAETEGQGWETEVPPNVHEEWRDFLSRLEEVRKLDIPRWISHGSSKGMEYSLHCFTDASDKCYAAAVYLRIESDLLEQRLKGSKQTACLVFAKGRVNPVKRLTIPRLELMGILIGVRALNHVTHELRLNIKKRYIWCDSTCTLQWLRSTRDLGKFVNNRIAEIRKSSDIEFRHVPSHDNAADLPTRTMEISSIPSQWFTGPPWLGMPESTWPNTQLPPQKSQLLLQPVMEHVAVTCVATTENAGGVNQPPFGLDLDHFPSMQKLIKRTAWIMRFINRVRDPKSTRSKLLLPCEMIAAEDLWVKHVQNQYVSHCTKHHPSFDKLMRNLGVLKDTKGVIRCKGRFGSSNLPYATKYPALLPRHHRFTSLIIQRAHEEVMHGGVTHTLSRIRNQFWITGGRSEVRSVLQRCVTCRRYEGQPFQMATMPDLPSDRTTPGCAFQNVGLDYFGPLYVIAGGNSTAHPTKKVWCGIFVCMKIRAVHLEMVEDMSASAFLLALRRFIARYGKPQSITSDNASQFELADSLLQKLWRIVEQDENVLSYCSDQMIQWRRITEKAPWQGGVYERLVQSVKRPLRKVLQQQLLTADQLRTLLHEVAAVVNTRPLIAILPKDDELAISDVLTPAHFLLPHPKPGVMINSDDAAVPTKHQTIIEEWLKGSRLLDRYWQAFINDYLPGLREQHTFHHRQSDRVIKRSPQENEIVLVHEPDQKRGAWKIGRVDTLVKSSDGKVRSARVQLKSRKVIQRPINLLYPLELTPSTSTQHPNEPQEKPLGEANSKGRSEENY